MWPYQSWKIEDYLIANGYQALDKVLFEMNPEDVIAEVKQSRIRGRGGTGYPTGLKWETVYKYVNNQKYVICNGDEGDPGAFMDRRCWKATLIVCWKEWPLQDMPSVPIKVTLIRGEYPLAIKRFELAIKQAKKLDCSVTIF